MSRHSATLAEPTSTQPPLLNGLRETSSMPNTSSTTLPNSPHPHRHRHLQLHQYPHPHPPRHSFDVQHSIRRRGRFSLLFSSMRNHRVGGEDGSHMTNTSWNLFRKGSSYTDQSSPDSSTIPPIVRKSKSGIDNDFQNTKLARRQGAQETAKMEHQRAEARQIQDERESEI